MFKIWSYISSVFLLLSNFKDEERTTTSAKSNKKTKTGTQQNVKDDFYAECYPGYENIKFSC